MSEVYQLTDGTIIIEPPNNEPIDPDTDLLFANVKRLVRETA
jgi:hypothetical protein